MISSLCILSASALSKEEFKNWVGWLSKDWRVGSDSARGRRAERIELLLMLVSGAYVQGCLTL